VAAEVTEEAGSAVTRGFDALRSTVKGSAQQAREDGSPPADRGAAS
jgi:hypothetical protein